MKVGLVSPYDFASPGGVTDHVRYLAGQLRSRGQEVRIFAPSSRADIDFDTREFYRIGSPIAVPVNDSVARITLSFHLANRVAAIIEEERFDVLHFHEPLMPALPITMLQTSTTANVGTFHAFSHSNIGYYYGRSILQPYLDRIHRGIAVSEPARTFFNRYFPDFPLRVIPNGIDVNVFKPGLSPIRHLRDDSVNILFVGGIPQRTAALIGGNVAGTLTSPPETLVIEGKGYHPLVDLTTLKLPSASSTLMAHKAWIQANHGAVQKFVDSLVEAIAREKADRAYAEQIMAKYLKLEDKAALAATYDFFALKILPTIPEVKAEQFKDAVDAIGKQNEKVRGLDLTTVIDNSFVEDAAKRGLAGKL